jgi:hypothetical protein
MNVVIFDIRFVILRLIQVCTCFVFSFLLLMPVGVSQMTNNADKTSGKSSEVIQSEIISACKNFQQNAAMISFEYANEDDYRRTTGGVAIGSVKLHMTTKMKEKMSQPDVSGEYLRTPDASVTVYEERSKGYDVVATNNFAGNVEHGPHYHNDFSVLIGVVPVGNRKNIHHLTEILPNLKVVRPSGSQISKEEIVTLKGEINGVEIVCSFVPKYDYALTQFKTNKKAEMVEDELISVDLQFNDFTSVGGIWFPSTYRSSIVFAFQKYEEEKTLRRGEAKNVWELKNYKILDENGNNDEIFKIKSPIPNYNEVSVWDVPQIDYVWLDGKIVPLTDELALRRALGYGFKQSGVVYYIQMWLIAAGIILFLLGIGIQIRKFLKKSRVNKGE